MNSATIETSSRPRQPSLKTTFDLFMNGQIGEARQACEIAVSIFPGEPRWMHLRGLIAAKLGKKREALSLIKQSVDLRPEVADFHANFGMILAECGRLPESIRSLRRAVQLNPNLPTAWRNLGLAFRRAGRADEALHAFYETARLAPDDLLNWQDIIVANLVTGEVGSAMASVRKLMEAKPSDARLQSELILSMHYLDTIEPSEILDQSREWAERFARPLYPSSSQPHCNDPSPDRRLRIGYISGDFREHPIGRLVAPILAAHDPEQFEIICYSDVTKPDEMTAKIWPSARAWHEVHPLSDEALARRIRDDQIDILVDLTGHMQMQRLLVFARKPAPIQISYLGYPNTTAFPTIDCRITDSLHDPTSDADALYTERLIRLPRCCWCYQPIDPISLAAPITPVPEGPPVFGCMNRMAKVTPRCLELWAQILSAVPDSRLRLLVDRAFSTAVAARFSRYGIDPSRLEMVYRGKRSSYLASFGGIWVHLDTFPYNGHTTTCDALWMGVPTVSMAGATHVQRAGYSVLSAVGLSNLVANSPEQYLQIATYLANDRSRLTDLRQSLRSRLQASPLGDAAGLAREIEKVFRAEWHRWCARKASVQEEVIC